MINENAQRNIFISYARQDGGELARKLRDSLMQAGHNVFFDEDSIGGGDNWRLKIEQGIISATHLIAIITPKSVRSDYCEKEWRLALRRHVRIIPVMAIKDCNLPLLLNNLQYIDFQPPIEYDYALSRILLAIKADTGLPVHPLPNWLQTPIKDIAIHCSRQKVACIEPTTSVAEAMFELDRVKYRYRHFLVTESGDSGDPLLGLIGLRQMLKVAHLRNGDGRNLTVSDIMDEHRAPTQPYSTFASLHEDDTLETALKLFITPLTKNGAANHFFYMSAIPIVNAAGGAAGIVSFKDILSRMLMGQIPIPTANVGDYMRDFEHISASLPGYSVCEAKMGMRPLGQRDIPVINNYEERKLVGLVPDHIFIMYYYQPHKQLDTPPVFEQLHKYLYTDVQYLKVQTKDVSIGDMLEEYWDESKVYFSFPVITNEPGYPRLLGLIGYRDIFKALLSMK